MIPARVRDRDIGHQRRYIRQQIPGFEFVDDGIEQSPVMGSQAFFTDERLASRCNALPSLIRSGLRATTTDHPEQGIGGKNLLRTCMDPQRSSQSLAFTGIITDLHVPVSTWVYTIHYNLSWVMYRYHLFPP